LYLSKGAVDIFAEAWQLLINGDVFSRSHCKENLYDVGWEALVVVAMPSAIKLLNQKRFAWHSILGVCVWPSGHGRQFSSITQLDSWDEKKLLRGRQTRMERNDEIIWFS